MRVKDFLDAKLVVNVTRLKPVEYKVFRSTNYMHYGSGVNKFFKRLDSTKKRTGLTFYMDFLDDNTTIMVKLVLEKEMCNKKIRFKFK